MRILGEAAVNQLLDQTGQAPQHQSIANEAISPWAGGFSTRYIDPTFLSKQPSKRKTPQDNRASLLRKQQAKKIVRLSTNPEQVSCPSHRQYKINSMHYSGIQMNQERKSSQQAKRLLGGLYGRLIQRKISASMSRKKTNNKQNINFYKLQQIRNNYFTKQIDLMRDKLAITSFGFTK